MTAMVSMPSERIDGKYNPLSMKRRFGQAPGIIALRGVGHVAAQQRPPADGADVGAPDRVPRRRPAACPGPWRGWPPGAWPRPRACSSAAISAGDGPASPPPPPAGASMTSPVPAGSQLGDAVAPGFVSWLSPSCGSSSPAPSSDPPESSSPPESGDGGVPAESAACCSTAGRRVAIPVTVVGVRLRQAVIGLFDADAVPGLGVRRQGETGVPQQTVGHQLGGALPALRVRAGPGACGA